VPDNTDFDYQWYLEGIALKDEVNAELSTNYGEGAYQVRIIRGSLCRISGAYEYIIPTFTSSDTVSICEGEIYSFGSLDLTNSGSYIETFKSRDDCDSTVSLELNVIGEKFDTIEATIAPGDTYQVEDNRFEEEGEYSLTLTSSLGCDSLVLLNLIHYKVFIPNVFSPNNDGVNDLFQPFPVLDQVTSYDMRIFDRWGTLIYRGDAWDGIDASADVYVYSIDVTFSDRSASSFYGTVTLLR